MIRVLANTFSSKAARVAVNVLAGVVLVTQLYLLYRFEAYVDCVADSATVSAERGRAIAVATDGERAAERDLLATPSAAGRERALQARGEVDRVRAANPPPAGPESC